MKDQLTGLALLALISTIASAEPDSAELPDLVVTGSRLSSQAPTLDRPLSVISRDDMFQAGAQSVGDMLQRLPYFAGAPLSTSVGARGQGGGFSRGVETAELRGLGSERTLVLLNGRRLTAAGNGTSGLIDLASLPTGMIERIEILRAAASVEYGADAVAGVVNIVTRKQAAPLQTRFKTGLSDRGDAEFYDFSAVSGIAQGRSYLLGGMQVFDQAAVGKGDRDFSARLLSLDENNQVVSDGSSAPPNGNYSTSSGRLTLRAGEDGDEPADFRPFINRGPDNDRYNFNPFEDLQQDSRRISAFALTQVPLSDSVNYKAELLWQRRDSDTQLAPLPFFTNRLDGVSVSADQLYNPFDEELSDVRRRIIEAGPRVFEQRSEYWRALAGFSGRQQDWAWDISFAYGHNKLDQSQSGDFLRDRTALALGPSFLQGEQARCGQPGAVIENCVPLNLFGGPGSITPEMLSYLASSKLQDQFENDQRLINLNVQRSFAGLAAGDAQIAFGYEYRQEQASDRPDAQTQAGNTTGAARAQTFGEFEAHEIYAELGVPLLMQQWGVESVNLDLGWRGVDFSNFDFEQVWEIGLQAEVLPDLSLNAAYSRAFRAPNIAELFAGVQQANPAVDDPCADFSDLSAAARERCIAQGVPADGSFNQTGNETPELRGGDPNLSPEQSTSFIAGLFWQINDAFNLRLDYYDIEIDDGISALGANTLLAECINNGVASFCERISRDPGGAISQVRSTTQNLARETARGLDLEWTSRWRIGASSWRQSLMLTHVLQRDLIAFDGAQAFLGVGEYDPDKFGSIPRWRGRYQLNWRSGALSAGYSLQWIGALKERGGEVAAGSSRDIPERFYHDLNLSFDWGNGLATRLGVDNLSDRQPPFFANADAANTDVSTYRLLGRRYWLTLRYSL